MNNVISTREIFYEVLNFKPTERTLKWEFCYWGGVIKRWYKEGLPIKDGIPENVAYGSAVFGPACRHGNTSYGMASQYAPIATDINEYFSFDKQHKLPPFDCWIYPKFETKIVYEDEKYIELYTDTGIRERTLKDVSSMPLWLEYPVKSRDDWERIKEERFNIDKIDSRWTQDKDAFLKESRNRDYPLHLLGGPCGFFGTLRFLIGEEKLYTLYYDDPKLIIDILSHLCELWINIIDELTSLIDFDIAGFWEDMAGKNGSLISPRLFKEFMTPYYKKLTSHIRSKGIKNIVVDTDGKVDELIPLFLEAGVNNMYPFEQQAGNDLIEIRKTYPELRIWGGFDKNTLYKGKKEIDDELQKMDWLISRGGFIPFADHCIPPNASWESFKYYRENLNRIIDSVPIKPVIKIDKKREN